MIKGDMLRILDEQSQNYASSQHEPKEVFLMGANLCKKY